MKLIEFERLSEDEQRVLLSGINQRRIVKKYVHEIGGRSVRFGYFSDSHIGSNCFDYKLWDRMVCHFKSEKIKVVYSPGDIVEGMSGRDGQVYELDAIGFQAQVELAAKQIEMLGDIQVYSILGNHDLWFKSKANIGASVGEALAERCKNYHHLGEWEADVKLAPGVVMKLFHANDGTAYATSYKIQKLIESLEGGKKPQIILSGHYHKALQLFTRNVFGFECGTICSQTGWMRGKKIPAHKGYGIINVIVRKSGGIERLQHEFFPCFD